MEDLRQFHIHHVINPTFDQDDVRLPKDYVGFVYASTLEQAFALSQNMTEEGWNPVTPCRSTSIGDFIQDGNQFYAVKHFGFDLIIDFDCEHTHDETDYHE